MFKFFLNIVVIKLNWDNLLYNFYIGTLVQRDSEHLNGTEEVEGSNPSSSTIY